VGARGGALQNGEGAGGLGAVAGHYKMRISELFPNHEGLLDPVFRALLDRQTSAALAHKLHALALDTHLIATGVSNPCL
jgi:hypothetical protein